MRILLSVAAVVCLLGLSAETFENDEMRIEFGDAARGYGVVGIVNKLADGRAFVQGTADERPDLWEIEFIRRDTRAVARYTNRNAGGVKSVKREDGRIVFRWKDVPLPENDGTFDIAAEVRFAPEGGSEWRLFCVNRGEHYAPRWTHYPILRRVVEDGEADVFRPYASTGARILKKCAITKEPCYWHSPGPCPLVLAYLVGDAGLYYAAHDGETRIKTLHMEDGDDRTIYFSTTLENSGVAGTKTATPGYPVVIRAFKGDWWECARFYRKWALKQKWCSAGPILKRGGSAKSAADRQIWMLCGGEAANVRRVMAGMDRAWPDVPKAIEWCRWYFQPDNLGTPEFFPYRNDMDVVQKEGVERGYLMMPYVNPRIWDEENGGFRYAVGDAVRKEFGGYAREMFTIGGWGKPGERHGYGIMCPMAKIWSDYIVDVCAKQMTNVNANAFYLDQVACSPAVECYNPAHGHPLGGGTWWEEGYRKMVRRIRDFGEAHGGVVITSEQAGETWMDLMDGLLLCDPPLNDQQVPFLQAVYSDYITYYGYQGRTKDAPDEYFRKAAQTFVWGIVPGWLDSMTVLDPNRRGVVDVLGRMARFRAAHMDWLGYGQLVGELKPLEPAAGVVGALWRGATSGSRAMVLANTAKEPRSVRFRFPRSDGIRTVRIEPMALEFVRE